MSAVVVCARCKNGYVAKRAIGYGICRECNLAAKRAPADTKPKSLLVAIERKVLALTVVSDPMEEDGGFRPGAVFGKTDWRQMLIHYSFTEGMILKDSVGRLYKYAKIDGGWKGGLRD